MTVNGHTNGHSNRYANGHTNGHPNGHHEEEKPFLPEGFLYGFSTAAAQIEGGGEEAEKASGRGDSIWDEFCRQPGKVDGGATIYRTCNHYELYKEDIACESVLLTGREGLTVSDEEAWGQLVSVLHLVAAAVA